MRCRQRRGEGLLAAVGTLGGILVLGFHGGFHYGRDSPSPEAVISHANSDQLTVQAWHIRKNNAPHVGAFFVDLIRLLPSTAATGGSLYTEDYAVKANVSWIDMNMFWTTMAVKIKRIVESEKGTQTRTII